MRCGRIKIEIEEWKYNSKTEVSSIACSWFSNAINNAVYKKKKNKKKCCERESNSPWLFAGSSLLSAISVSAGFGSATATVDVDPRASGNLPTYSAKMR